MVVVIFSRTKQDYHSNWNLLFPNFKFSTKEFYELIKNEMNSHDVDGLVFEEVKLKIGNITSSKRLYLRVRWREYFYDLCFAPFGDGCFVSWWLMFETTEGEEFLTNLPIFGGWIKRTFFPITYYKIDTASMFMTYSHNSILKVIDEITKETGFRLSEDQRKPNIKDFFVRK